MEPHRIVHGLLTILIGVGYAAVVVFLAQFPVGMVGFSGLATASSTLIVAALLWPAWRRLQNAVDRRFTWASRSGPTSSRWGCAARVNDAGGGLVRLTAFDKLGEFVERHARSQLVVGGRHPGRQVLVQEDELGAVVSVGERVGDRHLALHRGIVVSNSTAWTTSVSGTSLTNRP
jgi:hypothetical protein